MYFQTHLLLKAPGPQSCSCVLNAILQVYVLATFGCNIEELGSAWLAAKNLAYAIFCK